ncbi:MAG: DNA-binding transcriptional regulator [Thermoguttaceae bacterium]
MESPCRIALLLDRSLSFVRDVLRGIRAYGASRRPPWIIRDGPPRLNVITRVQEWRPHGIIAGLVVPRVAHALMRTRKPLVDTAFALPNLDVPTVDVDHVAVGRMAAEYFLDRRFVHFGFFGSGSVCYAQVEERAFRDRLAEQGYTVSSCYSDFLPDAKASVLWKKSTQKMVRWLRELPKPVAIFANEDTPARYLADLCGQIGLEIPDAVAILGVGNDELECRLNMPLLSSIAVPSQHIGYEAAALLDRLMAGQSAPAEPILLPPLRVVTRHSTDIMAVEDEIVQAAIQHIRRHASEPMPVVDVAGALAVGRRDLERRFRRLLDRSVLEEIHRVRIEQAAILLADTHLPVSTVARRAGFTSSRQLDGLFARLKGMTPTAFRRRAQAHRDVEPLG